jgi:hypothetical protein
MGLDPNQARAKHHVVSQTKIKQMATSILEARNLLPFQPSGWELTSYPADAGTTPSWSWSSQFGSGRHIHFEHVRRYVREECLGIQIMSCPGVPNFTSEGIQRPTTSTSLTVTAYVKWGEVRQSIFSSKLSGSSLFDYDVTENRRNIVADFWPDDPSKNFDDTGRLQVLCVLCAVAETQLSDVSKGDTMLTGIAVIPSSDDTLTYRRIGLLTFRYKHNDWFGKLSWAWRTSVEGDEDGSMASKSLQRALTPAAGVSQTTLDLV